MASPANTKLGLRMTTLHEEPTKSLPRKHSFDLLTDDTIEEQTEEGQNGKTEIHVSVTLSVYDRCFTVLPLQYIQKKKNTSRKTLPTSRTLDSLTEYAPKPNTPSASSSGYGSQAVSITNLSSDDSMSLKSISVDETPDIDSKLYDLQPVSEATDWKEVDVSQIVKNIYYNTKSRINYRLFLDMRIKLEVPQITKRVQMT